MWTGVSWFDGDHYTISARDCDARNMSPLDTLKVARADLLARDGQHRAARRHPSLPLHAALHARTAKPCAIVTHNLNSSWLSAQGDGAFPGGPTRLPAWDCNCAMFASPGDVARVDIAYDYAGFGDGDGDGNGNGDGIGPDTKVAILPNRATAVFGDSLAQTVMRAIYLDFAIGTMRAVAATEQQGGGGASAREAPPAQLAAQNAVWDADPTFTQCPEMSILKKKCDLPLWWDRVELSEFSDDDVDELALLAATDIAPSTVIARVGGTVVPDPTKYTIRLATHRHLHMDDGGGTRDSVFGRINHSFSPNVRCTPLPNEEVVLFESLRRIPAGEPLSFDYTTTEEPVLASPFVDVESGRPVGFPVAEE